MNKKQRLFNEILDVDINTYLPKDGRWETSLVPGKGKYVYVFNVEEDENCPRELCYAVMLYDPYGQDVYDVSFSRAGQYQDNPDRLPRNLPKLPPKKFDETPAEKNKREKIEAQIQKAWNKAQRRGSAVFSGVLKALGDFIEKINPKGFNWSPVVKRTINPITGQVQNPEARKKVYDIWAAKYLFPKYVGLPGDTWLRKDVWEEKRKTHSSRDGLEFPEAPENITDKSSMREKRQALSDFRNTTDQIEKKAFLNYVLRSFTYNPNSISEGDHVRYFNSELPYHPFNGRSGKVIKIDALRDRLSKQLTDPIAIIKWDEPTSLTDFKPFIIHLSDVSDPESWQIDDIMNDELDWTAIRKKIENNSRKWQNLMSKKQQANIFLNTMGHEIGDPVEVLTGDYENESGTITNFTTRRGEVYASILTSSGETIKTSVKTLQPPANSKIIPMENFSFKNFVLMQENKKTKN